MAYDNEIFSVKEDSELVIDFDALITYGLYIQETMAVKFDFLLLKAADAEQ